MFKEIEKKRKAIQDEILDFVLSNETSIANSIDANTIVGLAIKNQMPFIEITDDMIINEFLNEHSVNSIVS